MTTRLFANQAGMHFTSHERPIPYASPSWPMIGEKEHLCPTLDMFVDETLRAPCKPAPCKPVPNGRWLGTTGDGDFITDADARDSIQREFDRRFIVQLYQDRKFS